MNSDIINLIAEQATVQKWFTWKFCMLPQLKVKLLQNKQLKFATLNFHKIPRNLRCSLCTVRSEWKWSEAILWSKMLIYKRAFHKLRVLPDLCSPQKFWQLMRALKWGTIKGFPSRDIRMAKGQSFRLLTLLNKKSIFKDF